MMIQFCTMNATKTVQTEEIIPLCEEESVYFDGFQYHSLVAGKWAIVLHALEIAFSYERRFSLDAFWLPEHEHYVLLVEGDLSPARQLVMAERKAVMATIGGPGVGTRGTLIEWRIKRVRGVKKPAFAILPGSYQWSDQEKAEAPLYRNTANRFGFSSKKCITPALRKAFRAAATHKFMKGKP